MYEYEPEDTPCAGPDREEWLFESHEGTLTPLSSFAVARSTERGAPLDLVDLERAPATPVQRPAFPMLDLERARAAQHSASWTFDDTGEVGRFAGPHSGHRLDGAPFSPPLDVWQHGAFPEAGFPSRPRSFDGGHFSPALDGAVPAERGGSPLPAFASQASSRDYFPATGQTVEEQSWLSRFFDTVGQPQRRTEPVQQSFDLSEGVPPRPDALRRTSYDDVDLGHSAPSSVASSPLPHGLGLEVPSRCSSRGVTGPTMSSGIPLPDERPEDDRDLPAHEHDQVGRHEGGFVPFEEFHQGGQDLGDVDLVALDQVVPAPGWEMDGHSEVPHESGNAPTPMAEELTYSLMNTDPAFAGRGQDPAHVAEATERKVLLRRSLAASWVTGVVAKSPCVLVATLLLLASAAGFASLGAARFTVDMSFESFVHSGLESAGQRLSLLDALGHRDDGTLSGARRLQEGSEKYIFYDLSLTYELRTDEDSLPSVAGITDAGVLSAIAAFERSLRELEAWKRFCGMTSEQDRQLCTLGLSFVNYVLAEQKAAYNSTDIVPSSLNFDGGGLDMLPFESAHRFLSEHSLMDALFPSTSVPDPASIKTAGLMRSVFRFRVLCCSSNDAPEVQQQRQDALRQEWSNFAHGALLPVLRQAQEDEWPGGLVDKSRDKLLPFNFYASGTGFEELLVVEALKKDVKLAIGSLAAVFVLLSVQLLNPILALMGVYLVAISMAMAFGLCSALFGITEVGVPSVLPLFMIVAFCSEGLVIVSGTWRASINKLDTDLDRLTWTFKYAGKQTATISVTVALVLLANLVSDVKPLREFAVFLCVSVLFAWMSVMGIYLPFCQIVERYIERPIPGFADQNAERLHQWIEACNSITVALSRWRGPIVVLLAVEVVVAFGWGAGVATASTGTLSLLPTGHRFNVGLGLLANFEDLRSAFGPVAPPPPLSEKICRVGDFSDGAFESCSMAWCEVAEDMTAKSAGAPQFVAQVANETCQCSRRLVPSACGNQTEATLKVRFIGLTSLSQINMRAFVDRSASDMGMRYRNATITERTLKPVLMQEWDSGQVEVRNLHEMSTFVSRSAFMSCGWEEVCSCEAYVCRVPGFDSYLLSKPTASPPSGAGAASPDDGASIALGAVRAGERASIDVIFGLIVEPRSPVIGSANFEGSWRISPLFEMERPWTQRSLYTFCSEAPPQLRIVSSACWIRDFRTFLLARGDRFPITEAYFMPAIKDFSKSSLTGGIGSQEYLWIRKGKAVASYFQFDVDVSRYAPHDEVVAYQEAWDEYLRSWNAGVERYSRGAWHSSELWSRAASLRELGPGLRRTLVFTVLTLFASCWIFTWDWRMASLILLPTLATMSIFAWFVFAVLRWPLGPYEVIALETFAALAMAPSLHVLQGYASDEALRGPPPAELEGAKLKRFKRVAYALRSTGVAILGCAVNMCVASFFLLGCELTVLRELGGMLGVLSVLSAIIAVGPWPCILLMFGPQDAGGCCPSPSQCLQGLDDMGSMRQEVRAGFAGIVPDWAPPPPPPKLVVGVQSSPSTAYATASNAGGLSAPSPLSTRSVQFESSVYRASPSARSAAASPHVDGRTTSQNTNFMPGGRIDNIMTSASVTRL